MGGPLPRDRLRAHHGERQPFARAEAHAVALDRRRSGHRLREGAAHQRSRPRHHLPADRVALSAFHQLTARWALLSDITWTHWSQFDQLVFNFENPKQPTIVQPERWKDSFRYSVGTRYEPTRRWSFRLGAAYDETPVPDDAHRTARIPDADRIWASFGIGFR